MGTVADKISAAIDSKAAMQAAMLSGNFYTPLGDVLSAWPNDIRHVNISGDLQEYQFYMRFGGKGQTAAQRQSSVPFQPQITDVSIDFDHTTFPYNSLFYAFVNLTSLSGVPKYMKPRARKITSQPGGFLAYAFAYCTGISGDISVDLTEACDTNGTLNSNVAQSMFAYCTGLSGATLIYPNTLTGTSIINYTPQMFNACSGLKWAVVHGLSADPKYSSSGANTTFSGCNGLTSIEYTDVTQAYGSASTGDYSSGQNWFPTGLTSLNTVSFPSMTRLNCGGSSQSGISQNSMFQNLSAYLKHVYLPKCSYIARGAFHGLTCTVHLSEANHESLSACVGYSDNFTWKSYNGTPEGNVTLVYDM